MKFYSDEIMIIEEYINKFMRVINNRKDSKDERTVDDLYVVDTKKKNDCSFQLMAYVWLFLKSSSQRNHAS